jgi:amino acid adenylation domain-containing protein
MPNPDTTYEFPVSSAQARLLVLDRMYPGSTQYHVPVAFAVAGPLDIPAFTAALRALMTRHESLRTVFRPVGDEYVQIVAASAEAVVRTERPVAPAEVDAAMFADAARAFDVGRGPLLRCSVYPVTDGTHRILLTAHHLVCDGWSVQIMLRELSESYRAMLRGLPARHDPLPVQYPDYAAWQRGQLARGGYAEAIARWTELLRGAPEVLGLPARQPRPAVQTTAAGVERFVLAAATRSRLADLAGRRETTPFAVLFAAFNAFLSRISGTEDLVVGVPVSGRDLPQLQGTVGMLTNTLALRTDVSGDPAFGELVGRVRDLLQQTRPYQDAPFDAVIDAVTTIRALSHDPVVQVAFGYDDDTELLLELHAATVNRIGLIPEAAKFDLAMQLERTGPDLAGSFMYRSDLFDPATIRHWVRSFHVLLDSLLSQPDQPVTAVSMLSSADRAQLLRDFNRTATVVPDRFAHDIVAGHAAERPEATALVHGDTRLSYRELLTRADRLAGQLREAGVGPEVPVGICLPRSADMAIAALAVLRAGGAYVPLDPEQPPARLKHMLTDCAARLVIVAPRTAGLVAASGVPKAVLADGIAEFTAQATPVDSLAASTTLTPANTAYILYTSGSTGLPKGVMVEHRALTNLVAGIVPSFPVTSQDRVLQYVSFGFDVAVGDVLGTWAAGAELHIASSGERLGDALFARLRDSQISSVMLPPAAAQSLGCPAGALPCLRTMVIGGEAFPPELAGRWSAPGRRMLNAYGPSEAAVYTSATDVRPGQQVTIGRPLPNVRTYVLDQRLNPVPVGVVGELYLAGAGVARGYAGHPGLTAERFIADPFGAPGSRLYRTGDLARYTADGELIFHGRADTQVKLRGFRVELGEIEAILAAHPDIAAAAVVAPGAGHEQRLVAYVAGQGSGVVPGYGELRAWLADRLPGYMLPDAIVSVDRLPLSPNGKTDRARLPAPPTARPQTGHPYVAPATATERRLAGIWQRVLGLDSVGVHDNFFDVGGNSLRMLAVLAALADRDAGEGRDDVTLVDLFQHPDVAGLAAWLDRPDQQEPDREAAVRHGRGRRELLAGTRTRRRGPVS